MSKATCPVSHGDKITANDLKRLVEWHIKYSLSNCNYYFDTKLKSIYANYDYKVIPDVEPSVNFEEIYSRFDTDWAEDSVSSHASSIDDDDFEASFDEEDFR
jgi:hypothetical protein